MWDFVVFLVGDEYKVRGFTDLAPDEVLVLARYAVVMHKLGFCDECERHPVPGLTFFGGCLGKENTSRDVDDVSELIVAWRRK